MRQALKLHPDSRCTAVAAIEVDATRPRPGLLVLRYELSGAVDQLCLPARAPPTRADELWRHTCFEAFVRPALSESYCEFNLAPSTQWAAYRFNGYRRGMQPLEGLAAPQVEVRSTPRRLALLALVHLDTAPRLPAEPWRLGLSAVIEEADGQISYWALAHPPGKADFHHADCFALELPAPDRP